MGAAKLQWRVAGDERTEDRGQRSETSGPVIQCFGWTVGRLSRDQGPEIRDQGPEIRGRKTSKPVAGGPVFQRPGARDQRSEAGKGANR